MIRKEMIYRGTRGMETEKDEFVKKIIFAAMKE